jgi:16S rRNA (cytosine1402-N4)-methyltransferase
MVNEIIEVLGVREGGTYIDGTVGSGGHAIAILERIGPRGALLGIDRDSEAVERTKARLAGRTGQYVVEQGDFKDIDEIARDKGIEKVDGIILDLGVSSEQLEASERGFSFNNDGPLDMRMNTSAGTTAEELVNGLKEPELSGLISRFGEERQARRIARCIVRERQKSLISGTGRLAEIVADAVPRKGRIHPATRTFQALRIAVNSELECLDKGLKSGLDVLVCGGRMAVISFHSLEDRLVKRFFAAHVGSWTSLQAGGREWKGEEPVMSLVNRKPIRPLDEETKRNPRSRSAKLRAAERKDA